MQVFGVTSFDFTAWTDNTVLLITVILTLVSTAVNWKASKTTLPRQRPIFTAIAVVSALYAAAYAILLIREPDPTNWSSIVRGFSLISWVIVWIVPAIVSMRVWNELHEAMQHRIDDDEGEP